MAAKGDKDGLGSPAAAAMLILTVAVATRIVAWWNPVANVDDQFYLFVGREMLNGHWPYVDIWDRKPLGLFLLYSGIAWLGGGTILGLNLVASAFAAATAIVIRQIALKFSSATSATLAALVYLFYLPLYGGQTGQTAVFYNLFMACAAWLLFDATEQRGVKPVWHRATAAMLLCGLSISIKQVSFVEGAYFGLAFLWLLYRQGRSLPDVLLKGSLMIAVALGPTLAGLAVYWIAGPDVGWAYFHASYISIFQRTNWGIRSGAWGLVRFFLYLLPIILMSVAGLRARHKDFETLGMRLLVGWLIAALLGYAIVPDFFYHYALPVLVPLCVSVGMFFDRRSGPLFAAALAIFALVQGHSIDVLGNRRSQADFERLSEVVISHLKGGCLYLSDGPTWLYSTTSACRLTKFVFPDHLQLKSEANAIGVDPGQEQARVFAARPAVIVTQETKRFRYSPQTNAMLSSELEANYRLVHCIPDDGPLHLDGIHVWQRKDLAAPDS